MKKNIFFCICSFLSAQLLAQPFEKKQITNFDFDSRGATFPAYRIGLSFQQVSPFFFEAHDGNSSNIIMMSYNSVTDSFFNPTPITSNNYLNINLLADASRNWDNKINLIWQTNENGNWDIVMKIIADTGWSAKEFLVYSNSDETNPKPVISHPYYPPQFDIEFVYEKENSVYLYQQNDSTIYNKLVFGGNDSIKYSQPTGVYYSGWPFPPSTLYIAAKCQSNDSTSIIVYRYLQANDSVWSPIDTAYNDGNNENPNFHTRYSLPFLSFEKKQNGKKQIHIIPEIIYLGQNNSAVTLIDNAIVSSSDLISYHFAILTSKENFEIYSPFSYKIKSNDSTFIVYNRDYWINKWFYSKVSDTRIGLGNLGIASSYAISYTIWEDSSNGKINLFGIKRLDALGDIKDKTVLNNFILFQNYPNPFNPKTVIQYNLLSRDYVTLKVYDLLGNEVATVVKEEKDTGEYKLEFDGSNLASGIYVYRLSVGSNHVSKKMILLK